MEDKIIYFKEGIPGFETLTEFILLEEGDGIFYYLKSVEEPHILFPLLNPYLLSPDYAPNIHESYFEKLGGGETGDFTLYVIATLKDQLEESTVNLRGPLLIHVNQYKGVQAIVEDKCYQTRHKIADLMQGRGI